MSTPVTPTSPSGFFPLLRALVLVPILFSIAWRDAAAQQTGVVEGTVVEAASRQPIPGAQVYVPGTTFGAVTDDAGAFRLTGLAPGRAVVRVEMVGYAPVDAHLNVTAEHPASVSFELTPQVFQLDAVVVTGTAGTARRREVAHAIDEIVVDQVVEPVPSLDALLENRVPGLDVLSSSGIVGSGSQIRLRGNVSFALSNQPLVYVDGVRIRSDGYPKNVPPIGDQRRGPNDVPSPLDDINPLDIEHVEIVKGPAATTLYGSEGATGVIQVFTRRGERGAPRVSARVDQGFSEMQPFGTESNPYMWLDPWLKTAWQQRYAASVGGGGDLRYYASGSYEHNEGVLPNDKQERMVARANLDLDPADEVRLSWTSSYTRNDLDLTSAGRNAQGLTYNAMRGPRTFLDDSSHATLAQLLKYDIDTNIDHLISGVTASWSPSSAMSHRLILGYDREQADLRQLRPVGFVFAPDGILSDQDWTSQILTLDYVGNVEVPLAQDVRTTLSWGGQSVTSKVRARTGYAEGFPGPGQESLETGALQLDFLTESRVTNGGVFGQTVVGWRDRLFLTGGLRLDGNSAFGDDLGLQVYPRLGLSYVISDEPWWPVSGSRLKLRTAYGHAGRAPGPFDAVRTWRDVGPEGDPAFLPSQVGNPELGPERTRETELGLDAAFLDDRLTASATVYFRKTSDALFPVTQTPSLGFTGTQLENVGELQSSGVELGLNGVVVRGHRVSWDLGLNLATNYTEATDLGGSAPLRIGSGEGWIVEGQPVPVIRGPFIRNPHSHAEPIVDEDHFYGPNYPPLTLGFLSLLRLPSNVVLSVRAEYAGGFWLPDAMARTQFGLGVSPLCEKAYPLLEQGRRDELTAFDRIWCDPDANFDEGPFWPADYFRLRDVTLQVPLPIGPGGRGALLSVSARDWLTWTDDDFRLGQPDMTVSMHDDVRRSEGQLPPPATFVFSIQAVP